VNTIIDYPSGDIEELVVGFQIKLVDEEDTMLLRIKSSKDEKGKEKLTIAGNNRSQELLTRNISMRLNLSCL
jgi:hypothetical protein